MVNFLTRLLDMKTLQNEPILYTKTVDKTEIKQNSHFLKIADNCKDLLYVYIKYPSMVILLERHKQDVRI